ncbi:MAG: helix-turn-helix transcriptional regulator [Paracoccaceae bacterium]|jgi:DNA-binding CsgD family transcriptional regulator
MTETDRKRGRNRRETRRATVLAVTLALQSVACVFFIADAARDFPKIGTDLHTTFEALVAVALIVGTGFGALEMRRTLKRIRQAEEALSLASGAFDEVVRSRFADWRLTPSEAEVALFALKGLEVSDIARMRGTAPGTVRVQLGQVYAKSGSANRAQFVSLFVEELMSQSGLAPAA